jgi:hypothetical protein
LRGHAQPALPERTFELARLDQGISRAPPTIAQ